MRVVAVGASHLALWNRVVGRPVHLRTLFLVAGVTDFGLGFLVAGLVVAVVVYVMATCARHAPVLVGTAGPEHAVAALVAGGAGLVLLFGRGGLLEDAPWGRALAARGLLQVRVTVTVARRTGGGAAVGYGAMLGFADGEQTRGVGFIVAARTLGVALEDEVVGASWGAATTASGASFPAAGVGMSAAIGEDIPTAAPINAHKVTTCRKRFIVILP